MVELQTAERVSTRDRIIDTAERLILEQGYVGTSIEDILQQIGLTKGGFFYHFKSKADLGRAVVEKFAEKDFGLFQELSRQADASTADPLESTLALLKMFESFVTSADEPPGGCIFASYIYESAQFDRGIKDFIRQGFKDWGGMYVARFDAIKAIYPPSQPVDSAELSETLMSIYEGAFIMAKAFDDPQIVVRTSRQFRQYLELLFSPQYC